MKSILKYFRVAAAFFACLVVIAALGGARPALAAEALKARRIAVLPWKVNAAEDIGFVSGAMVEMLSSRIGSTGGVEMVRPGPLKDGPNDEVAAGVYRVAARPSHRHHGAQLLHRGR